MRYFIVMSGIIGGLFYILWWVHNSHPLLAALAAGVMFVIYDDIQGRLLLIRDRKIAELESRQQKLINRLEQAEQKIDEIEYMEDDDDPALGGLGS